MKTINILLTVALAIVIESINVNAQFIVRNKVLREIDFENKIIYFETKDVSEQQINNNKDLLDSIKNLNKLENELLNEVISDHWYISDKTEKLSENEISVRIKNKRETLYLRLNRHTDKFFDRKVHKLKKYYSFSHYKLSLYRNKKEVISIPLLNKDLSELDLHFALSTIQRLIMHSSSFKNLHNYTKEVNTKARLIREKTLLVSDKLTDYSKQYIQQFYESDLKITNEKEILQAIHNKDEKFVYLMITINDFSDKPSFNHIILDCIRNEPLLIYRNSTAFSKPCKHSCIVHHHDERLGVLFSSHFKKYQKIITTQAAI